MSSTVANQFAETLTGAGLKRINGILGDSLNRSADEVMAKS